MVNNGYVGGSWISISITIKAKRDDDNNNNNDVEQHGVYLSRK